MILAKPIWDTEKITRELTSAFVIMPFREKWSSYIYQDYIAPLLKAATLHPKRSDEMFGRNVLEDIWKGIYASRLVVADVSTPNENVFYELGIAHTLGKQTILITQNVERIPFDLRNQRMIVYSDDHPGYLRLKSELPRHIAAILSEPIDEMHHVRSILGGFMVEKALFKIELAPGNPSDGSILDSMDIIGVRENTVLINKAIELPGVVGVASCNHRFTRSTAYPDHIRVNALFDPPYLQPGTKMNVTFRFSVQGGFKKENCSIPYTIGVDTESLVIELVTPKNYGGHLKISLIRKPLEFEYSTPAPISRDGLKIFHAEIPQPEVGATFALRWTDPEQSTI